MTAVIRISFLVFVLSYSIYAATDWNQRFQDQLAIGKDYINEVNDCKNEFQNLKASYLDESEAVKQEYDDMVQELLDLYQKNIEDFFANEREDFEQKITTVDSDVSQIEKYQEQDEARARVYFKRLTEGMEKYKTGYEKKFNKTSISVEKARNVVKEKYDQLMELRNAIESIIDKMKEDISAGVGSEIKVQQIAKLSSNFHFIAKQLQLDSYHSDERQRTNGNSGIKQIRSRNAGSKNYFSATHVGGSFSAIHNHDNHIRTVGMGEFIGVLNGVEFRTRHNDYRLYTPSTTIEDYHKTSPVPFPDTPPSVLNKPTLTEQIEEMREYFRAFHLQDEEIRDYKPYFKPVITYLEGTWTAGSAGGEIDEPFESDRHHIDAKSWQDLQDKVRFTSYAGQKSLLENLAHLPTKVIRFTKDKEPVLAQWNYRLLVHPIDTDLAPLEQKDLKLVVDQTVLKGLRWDVEKYRHSRAAKFDIEGIDENGEREEGGMDYTLLDKIMEQIPGKNNYVGADGVEFHPFGDASKQLYHAKKDELLKAGYYNRVFRENPNDEIKQFGFADRVYIAHTTHEEVAQVPYYNEETKTQTGQGVSYAIPVEVIWTTPLNGWNPHNIMKGEKSPGDTTGKIDKPLEGYYDNRYFITPDKFFTGDFPDGDPADTSKGTVFVKPTKEAAEAVKTRSAGVRIIFPNIEGIDGKIRQRYPVMPVHGEGSALWKKLNAAEDLLNFAIAESESETYLLQSSKSTEVTTHSHSVILSKEDLEDLENNDVVYVTSEIRSSHSHSLAIVKIGTEYHVFECDGDESINNVDVCKDKHPAKLQKN